MALTYSFWRTPTPSDGDISRWVQPDRPTQTILVRGAIANEPRITRNQSVWFWLEAWEGDRTPGDNPSPETVSGKLYVTVPLLLGTGLEAGQEVAIVGRLYAPQPADAPGAFDFQAYLARQGSFAGFRGSEVTLLPHSQLAFGYWVRLNLQAGLRHLRQNIVQAQAAGLGVGGLLVSSMVLGRRAVDLPYDLYDQFVQVGMAHTLAASGFHVTLLLGLVVGITQGMRPIKQGAIAVTILVIYMGLTGFHPSVLRAGIMGVAALVGLMAERRVNALRSLLLAAVCILIYNPLWVFDLGFQLSFLATLGLLVLSQPLTERLDWLPPNIATLIAIPTAAFLWTIPIQLYNFGVMPIYSILANVLLTPLIWMVSLGGMITGAIAILHPTVGSYAAETLRYPVELLIHSVEIISRLPGHTYAIGQISLGQVGLMYGLFLGIWSIGRWQAFWWVGGLGAIALIVGPNLYQDWTQFQITVLPSQPPSLVWQYRGSAGIIDGSEDAEVQYGLLPFLKQQGINQITTAIALPLDQPDESGWYRLMTQIPVQHFYSLDPQLGDRLQRPTPSNTTLHRLTAGESTASANSTQATGHLTVYALPPDLPGAIALLEFPRHRWLVMDIPEDVPIPADLIAQLPQVDGFWWTDAPPSPELLDLVNPQVAIAPKELPPDLQHWFTRHTIPLYITEQDGAITWMPNQIRTYRSPDG